MKKKKILHLTFFKKKTTIKLFLNFSSSQALRFVKLNFKLNSVEMGAKSNRKVIGLLCLVEGLLSLTCGVIHVVGLQDPNEPTQHQMIFWGNYFGLAIASFCGFYRILRVGLKWKKEAVVATFGFVIFTALSITAMANVEKDPHLPQMNDVQEFEHHYFKINYYQSMTSLITGLFFLLHAVFAIEFVLSPSDDDLSIASEGQDDDTNIHNPLKLHFFFDDVWKFMKNLVKK